MGDPTVTVAVLTYRRPDDLAAALPLLVGQAAELDPPGEVLVVDNDPDRGAPDAVAAAGARYVHEPIPGIAAARNRALDEAGTDLLVFVDDDERPVPGWLRALVDTWLDHRSAGVVGPVVSEFAEPPDPWIVAGRFFVRRRLPTGTPVRLAATNNLLLDLAAVRDRQLRFDQRFGLVGGSDTLFTGQLTAGGGRLVWCAEATVVDVVPPARLTRRWVLRRAFRSGNGASLVEVELAGSGLRSMPVRVRQVIHGLVRVGGGLLRVAVGILTASVEQQARGARNVARGAGLVSGAVGFAFSEYARPAAS
jgi:glycosyltransferase involved in cell wall biosynthesis